MVTLKIQIKVDSNGLPYWRASASGSYYAINWNTLSMAYSINKMSKPWLFLIWWLIIWKFFIPEWNFNSICRVIYKVIYDYMESFIPWWKFWNFDLNEKIFLNEWNFLFLSGNETKVTIIWRKIMFHPGMKVSTRGQLAGMKFHLGTKYLIFYMWP